MISRKTEIHIDKLNEPWDQFSTISVIFVFYEQYNKIMAQYIIMNIMKKHIKQKAARVPNENGTHFKCH